ncbi:hypothetical protein [Microbulbifer sp. 2205BS26-8]|uniref:hypothetical protein n=1 Tax=Microbulbifer sp. 2205BS26-8 TaxID=3064386 RepID=UPI00273DDD2C|nr:hypothetical protein [Microbulbifer sp. 2205BS26-8]MDP5211190.1 hypothetical protein [Microbulbifer sp. 2205BS26-8]
MINSVFVDIESPDHAALLNCSDGSYEIVRKPEGKLCSGYGYFKFINGEKKLAALLAYKEKLYLYFDRLYELDEGDCRVELKSGFFKDEFKLFKKDELILSVKYKPTSYDAGVFEEVSDLIADKKYSSLRIQNTIKILSETDPALRQKVDQECVSLLEKAKSS